MPRFSSSDRSPRSVQSRIVGDARKHRGDAPPIGPVARMEPGTCPHRRRRVHHGSRGRLVQSRKVPLWLILVLAGACTALIVAIVRGGK